MYCLQFLPCFVCLGIVFIRWWWRVLLICITVPVSTLIAPKQSVVPVVSTFCFHSHRICSACGVHILFSLPSYICHRLFRVFPAGDHGFPHLPDLWRAAVWYFHWHHVWHSDGCRLFWWNCELRTFMTFLLPLFNSNLFSFYTQLTVTVISGLVWQSSGELQYPLYHSIAL